MDAPTFECVGCNKQFTKKQITEQKQLTETRSEVFYKCACGFTAIAIIDDELGEANIFINNKDGILMDFHTLRGEGE